MGKKDHAMLGIAFVSYLQNNGKDDTKSIQFSKDTFGTGSLFNIGAFTVMIILVVVYALFR